MAEETQKTSSGSNLGMKVLAYVSLLWIIPYLLVKGEERDAAMVTHLKQGLGCMIVGLIGWLVGHLPLLGFIGWVIEVVGLVLSIIGIINVFKGKAEQLPIVGGTFDSLPVK